MEKNAPSMKELSDWVSAIAAIPPMYARGKNGNVKTMPSVDKLPPNMMVTGKTAEYTKQQAKCLAPRRGDFCNFKNSGLKSFSDVRFWPKIARANGPCTTDLHSIYFRQYRLILFSAAAIAFAEAGPLTRQYGGSSLAVLRGTK